VIDVSHVRPIPPSPAPNFLDGCKVGKPLEVQLQDGWWEVAFYGMDGPKYVVGAERYRVQHRVGASRLRPAWKWDRENRTWGVHVMEVKVRETVSRHASKSVPRPPPKVAKKDKELKTLPPAATASQSANVPSQSVRASGSAKCTKTATCVRSARHPGLCRLPPASQSPPSGQSDSRLSAKPSGAASDRGSSPPPDEGAQECPAALLPPLERPGEFGAGQERRGRDGRLYKVVQGMSTGRFEWRLSFTPHVGQRVWSHYGKDADELWWAGSIVEVRHKAVDVQYDDGDVECSKPLLRVVPLLPDAP